MSSKPGGHEAWRRPHNLYDTMELEYKPDFERACKHWDALWNHDIIARPCTLVTVQKTDVPGRFNGMEPVEGDFQKAVVDFDRVLETHEFLGEAMPAFRPGFGPDQMAAFVGAPLTISQDSEETSWSEKIVDDWDAGTHSCRLQFTMTAFTSSA